MQAEDARTRLEQERRSLDELASSSRAGAPVPSEEVKGSEGTHPGDAGTDRETQMEDHGLADDAERQRDEIDAALARIDEGTWGTCVVCGQPIDDERLEARPQAERCRQHQDELERAQR